MDDSIATTKIGTQTSLVGGLLAAFGATACCFGPLAFVVLGIGGVWAGRLQRLEAYAPYFYALTLLFIGIAFHRLYVRPRRCSEGEICGLPDVLGRQRIMFWVVVALVVLMVAAPVLAPLFY